MKRLTLILLALCIVFSSAGVFASEWQNIYVTINEININVDGNFVNARNFVHEGTTYLSLRDMGNVLGYEVGWDGETNTASLTSGAEKKTDFEKGAQSTETISVLVNDVNVVVDGNPVNARNFLYNDTTYLALRDIGNATGYQVGWDETSSTAILLSQEYINETVVQLDIEKLNAKVNGINVPKVWLHEVYQQIPLNYTEEQLFAELESNCKRYAYYADEAKRLGITLTEDEKKIVEDTYKSWLSNANSDEALNSFVTSLGYASLEDCEKELKAYWETQMLAGKLTNYIYENDPGFVELKSIAKPEYEKQIEELKRPTVVVKHILIPFDNDGDNTAEKAKAEAILKLLEKGEDFDLLLSQNNNDPGQGSEGYEVYIGCGFVEEFEDAALKLKKGEISGIVETGYGYHIIKALDDYIYQMPFDEFFQSDFRIQINQMFDQLYTAWEKDTECEFGWRK